MRNIIYLSLCLLLFNLSVKAQQAKKQLSLEEAINLAMENNRLVNKAKEQGRVAKADYKQTNSVFLPQLNISHTAFVTNDPLSAFGFKLKQEITTQNDFNPVLLNDPSQIENYNTKIEVQQPLINMDGFYARKAANAKMQAIDFTTERTIFHTRFQVKKAYYQLELTQKAVQVIEKSLLSAQSALKLTEDNMKQGFAKEADYLAVKVRVLDLQTQLADVKNNQIRANEYLAYLIGIDIATAINTLDKLGKKPLTLGIVETNEQGRLRSDLMAYKKSMEARESVLKSEKMRFLPKLNAFGAYEWNDDQVFGTNAKRYLFGASLSWNLFNGYKNVGKVQKAKAELKIAKLELADYESKNRIDIKSAKRNLQVAFNRVDMNELAKKQAEEAYRIRNNRYKQGLEKTTDLLQSEAESLVKNLGYINSLYQYHLAVFQLELLLEKELQ